MRYEAIIFDVSDTLTEYSPNYAQIYSDRMRYLNFEVSEEKSKEISRAVYWTLGEQSQKEQNGEPVLSHEERITMKDRAALSCVIDKGVCVSEYLKALRKLPIPEQRLSIIPGVIDVLDTLKNKYRLAIVSNHHTWLMDYLCKVGLAPYFETIIISEIVGVEKPNVRIMQIVLEELKLKSESCLYVGDQPIDVLCSKIAGMDCAWIVTDGSELPESVPYKEDYKISKLSELLRIL